MSSQETRSSSIEPLTESMKKLTRILFVLIAVSVISCFYYFYVILGNSPHSLLPTIPIIVSALMAYASLRIFFLPNISVWAKTCACILFICEAFFVVLILSDLSKGMPIGEYLLSLFNGVNYIVGVFLPMCMLLLSIGIRKKLTNILFSILVILSMHNYMYPRYDDYQGPIYNQWAINVIYWAIMVVSTWILCFAIKQKLENGQFELDQSTIDEAQPESTIEEALPESAIEEALPESAIDEAQQPDRGDENLSMDSSKDESVSDSSESISDLPEVCFKSKSCIIKRMILTVLVQAILLTFIVIRALVHNNPIWAIIVVAVVLICDVFFFGAVLVHKLFLSERLVLNKNGINKFSWKDIADIDYEMTEHTILGIPLYTNAEFRIVRKNGGKHRINLGFRNPEEVVWCYVTIRTYFDKYTEST